MTAYSSKKTLKDIHNIPDQNDTSMAIRFTANVHSVLSLGDLQNQEVTYDEKFKQKVMEKEYGVLLGTHHGLGNSATEAVANLGELPIKHIIFSGTSYSGKASDIWNKYSGGYKMSPYYIARTISQKMLDLNETKFYITGYIEGDHPTNQEIPYFNLNQNSFYKWSSLTNEITKEEETIINSGAR